MSAKLRTLRPTKTILVCTKDPHTNTPVVHLCNVAVDLKPLRPFNLKVGVHGREYYEIDYDLGVIFGPELVFRFVKDGRIMGSVTAEYP